MNKIMKSLVNEKPIADVEFRQNFPGGITGALKLMNVGYYYFWDGEEFCRHTFHAIAHKIGIRIATKRHNKYSCFVVLRIK